MSLSHNTNICSLLQFITDDMEKSKSLHLIIDVHIMMEVACRHFQASLSHGLDTVSDMLENFPRVALELFMTANTQTLACLKASLTLPSLNRTGYLLGS